MSLSRADDSSTEATNLPSGVRTFILLSGSLRAMGLQAAIRRSILDLPVRDGQTLLGYWRHEIDDVARALGWRGVPLRVLVDGTSPVPEQIDDSRETELHVERDPLEYRGTAGVLKDICGDYERQDRVLVANARQLTRGPLVEQVQALARAGGDVSILAPTDGTPSSLMLIRCGVLAHVPEVGFSDLKEQALPLIAAEHDVKVVRRDHPVTRPIRDSEDYLACLRDLHLGRLDGEGRVVGPFEEQWRPAFALVEEGAHVDPTAQIQDSVVLAGARVAASARVVRSVVGPSGSVGRRHLVIGRTLGSPERSKIRQTNGECR